MRLNATPVTVEPVITSLDNPRVKEVLRLRTSRERRKSGLLVAEGPREVERALAAGLRAEAIYVAPELIEWASGEEVSAKVLAKMAYRAEPEGVIGVFAAPTHELPASPSLLIVCVGIEKPGNLGAIARSASAAGADALIIAEGVVDPFNPNAIRASTGAVFTLPIVELTLDQLIALDVPLVAAVVGAPTPLWNADLRRPIALVIGAEDDGLDDRWRRAAAQHVSLPMRGDSVDSLNAANAAAVMLFEVVRQRSVA